MPRGYTKEDVIQAAMLRFRLAKSAQEQIVVNNQTIMINIENLEKMFNDFYDEKGKDEFRKYASVDAEAMKTYFNWRDA